MTAIPSPALLGTPQCSRYRADGTKCPHHTAQPDGWCRAEDCDGYRSASAPVERDLSTSMPRGRRLAAPAREMIARPDPRVRITASAARTFVETHGGTFEHAQVEIRAMLDDMWQHGRARVFSDGAHILYLAGFGVMITRQGDAVIRYYTVHRERSYAQVQAGVRSRASADPNKQAREERNDRAKPATVQHDDPYDAVADWV